MNAKVLDNGANPKRNLADENQMSTSRMSWRGSRPPMFIRDKAIYSLSARDKLGSGSWKPTSSGPGWRAHQLILHYGVWGLVRDSRLALW